MATSSIYFNREGVTRLDIGKVTSIQYANVTLSINGTVIHTTGSLPKGQDYYEWNISDAEKALIMSLLPTNSRSVNGKMKVDVTWEPWGWDAPLFSEEYTVSFILEETEVTKPTLTPVSKSSSEYGDYVQGRTRLIYKIKAEAKNGATLNKPTATVNGRRCTLLNEDGNGNYTLESEWLVNSGTNNISVSISDSRGFSRSFSDEIYVHPYLPPSISSLASEMGIVCRRWRPDTNIIDDIYGTQCRVAVGVSATFIPAIQTGYTVTYRFRKRGEDEWSEYLPVGNSNEVTIDKTGVKEFRAVITDETTTGGNGVLVGKFNVETEYDIMLRVTDHLGGEATRYEQLQSQETSFNINDEGNGVAVGKYATRERCFDSAWDIHTDKDIEAEGNAYIGNSLYLRGSAVTASAEEINHCEGVTDNIQEQLDNKADESHYHMPSEIYADAYCSTTLDEKLSSIDSGFDDLISKFNSLASEVDSIKKSLNT